MGLPVCWCRGVGVQVIDKMHKLSKAGCTVGVFVYCIRGECIKHVGVKDHLEDDCADGSGGDGKNQSPPRIELESRESEL